MFRVAHRACTFALVVIVITTLTFTLSMGTARAWTHEKNHYDSNPNDYTCGYSASVPCLYWPEPNGLSSKVAVYLDPAIATAHYFDLRPSVQAAINNFNAAPALNPYLYTCSPVGCGSMIYTMDSLAYGVYGETCAVQCWGTEYNASGQYYAYFQYVEVAFSSSVYWNTSLTFDPTHADARTVAAHETGHAEGLGHTGHSNALMFPTPVNGCGCYTLQSDDLNGLESFYTGTIPA